MSPGAGVPTAGGLKMSPAPGVPPAGWHLNASRRRGTHRREAFSGLLTPRPRPPGEVFRALVGEPRVPEGLWLRDQPGLAYLLAMRARTDAHGAAEHRAVVSRTKKIEGPCQDRRSTRALEDLGVLVFSSAQETFTKILSVPFLLKVFVHRVN